MGFENVSTEVLLVIQGNLLKGLDLVGKHVEAGTFKKAVKEGAAPPAQFGNLVLTLLLAVEDELEARILGFQRTVDVKLIKTL